MKRNFKLFTLAFALMFAIIVKVNASDLSKQLKLNDGLGGLSTYEVKYNEFFDITEVDIRLTLNETVIDTILDQHPGYVGSNAKLGWFYITLDPGLTAPLYKQNEAFSNLEYNLDYKTIEEMKEAVRAKVGEEDKNLTEDAVWPIGLIIRYKDSNGNWAISTTPGDGVTTIRQDLANKLGVATSELKYGENYRFEMYENKTYLYMWSDVNPNTDATATVEEFVSLNFEMAFPIKSSSENESIYHLTLEDAIENGHNIITIHEDLTITEDIELPLGTVIQVVDGATLTLDNAEIKGDGFVSIVEGTITDGTNNYYNVSIAWDENGEVAVDKYLVAAGEKVTIAANANEGYKVSAVKVYDETNGQEIEVKDNTFIMPEDHVYIEATFEEENTQENIKDEDKLNDDKGKGNEFTEIEEPNPNTGDNVAIFVVVGLLSLMSVVIATNKLRKNA